MPIAPVAVRAEALAQQVDAILASHGAAKVNLIGHSMGGLDSRYGDRGYRAVQLEAGVRSGRVYLAATALGLRVTGLTFYDDEVASALGIDTADTAVLMLVAAGR